jgi:ABC-type anion transport system duplicated permease subunit
MGSRTASRSGERLSVFNVLQSDLSIHVLVCVYFPIHCTYFCYLYKSAVGREVAHHFSCINGCTKTAEQHWNNCGENLTTWLSLFET